jgi:hypothetical protein
MGEWRSISSKALFGLSPLHNHSIIGWSGWGLYCARCYCT